MTAVRAWAALAALIAGAGVVIHVGAVVARPAWFAFFHAPPRVVASARAGTWLAPASALVIAGLMAVCAAYAASALGWLRRPPLQRPGLTVAAAVCLLRAVALPVLAVRHPELRNTFEVVSAVVWGFAGVGFVAALRLAAGASRVRSPVRRAA